MIAPGILLMFAGYSLGSYGYVLVKGWNITLRQWLSPTNPWTWPSGDVPLVPRGQIFPGGATLPNVGLANPGTVQGVIGAANNAFPTGLANPGQVQGVINAANNG